MELCNSLRFLYKADSTSISPNFLIKSILCGLITMMAWGQTFAQEEDIFQGELTKINKEVKSPESSAFEKYGDPEVSLYTGVPQISVPLHVVNGREFSLPVSLTYDASGVQVEQMATWVGLSWNLNVGGRISRVTNGLPDDYTSGAYGTIFNNATVRDSAQYYIDNYASSISSPIFPSAQAATEYAHFLFKLNNNFYDTQVDHFKVSAPGLNATVVLEKNAGNGFTARALNNPRIKITYNLGPTTPDYIGSWTVTNEDGTKYIFSDQELTFRQNLGVDSGPEPMGDANTTYVSSWLLTQIVSKNGKDTFDFTYDDEGDEPNREFATSAGSVTTEILNNIYTYSAPTAGNYSNVVSSVKQLFPSLIKLNNKLVVDLTRGMRKDIDITDKNKRLATIDFFDGDGNTIKSVDLDNNHYFNADGLSNSNIFSTGKTYSDIRLKLDGVTIKGRDNNAYQNYYFEYFSPDNVPSLASMAQDYFGYYNGANSNTSLYEHVQVDNYNFAGANRDPSFSDGIKGTLKKITYPTGGYSEFTFESHKIFTSQSNTTEDAVLNILLNQNNATTPSLYRNDQGFLCDDKYVSPFDPRIVIQTFYVIEEDDYTLSLVSSNNDSEFYVVDPMNISAPYNNYCDFYNGPVGNNVAGPFYTSTTQTVHLTPGKYKALLLLGNLNSASSFSAWAKISRNQTTVNWLNKDIGGQRIATIKNYTSSGNLATQKSFDYTNYNSDSGYDESTGSINYIPILHSIRENDTETGTKSQLIRYSSYAKGSEPYVVYSSVKESMIGVSNELLGYTKHNFFKGQVGDVPMNTAPYENWYFPSLSVGNLSSKTVSDLTNNLVSEQYGYYETVQRPISIKSMVVYVDNDNFQKTIFLKDNDNGTPNDSSDDYVTYEYLNTFECQEGTVYGENGTLCAVPDYYTNYQNYGYLGYLDPKYSPYRARVSKTNGAYGGLDYYSKTSSFYDSNGNLISTVSSEENTVYDNNEASPKYLPRTKTVTDSKGNVIETTFTYPHDGVVNGSSTMVTQNKLSEVVMTQTKMNPGPQNEKDLSSIRKDYVVLGTAVMPDSITTTKGGNTAIGIGEFSYYPGGNIKIAKRVDGPSTYYIWGYDSELTIAKISNFDETDAGLLQTWITACQNASDSDNGTTTAENALRTALENLRTNLPDGALMTGYTYDPSIGVTSIMDPRGYVTFYEYDEFNRLKNVKDNDLKLLNDYQYHYKGQN